MPDTLCTSRSIQPAAGANCCAMIFRSPEARAISFVLFRVSGRNTPMTLPKRIKHSCRVLVFFYAWLGIPSHALSATVEDSARDFAQKIAAALPSKENVTCEIRNVSSLQTDEIARIDAAFKSELKDRGVSLASGSGPARLVVTLSENFRNLVWTGEIHDGDATRVVLVEVQRSQEFRASEANMPAAIRSEKFWEGPEQILDAGEISDGSGKSWLVLLLPGGVQVTDKQSGATTVTEITSNQSASRDPWGLFGFQKNANDFGFFLSPRFCTMNLPTRKVTGCSASDDAATSSPASSFPIMIDVTPSGTVLPGKGTKVVLGASVCGGANQFLATGPGDYTQTDSLQLFELKSAGASAASAELSFPGPITALHASSESPRAVVKNLSTGNYEAYRLSFSCAQ